MKTVHKHLSLTFLLLSVLVPSFAQGVSILAFGDSITQGVPYVMSPGNGARNGGYEPFLEEFFAAAGTDAQIYNWGVAGDTSSGGLTGTHVECVIIGVDPETGEDIKECHTAHTRNIDTALASQGGGDNLLILIGTNDFFSGISPQTTVANLCEIAARGQAYGMVSVIATLTPDFRGTGKSVETINSYITSQAANCGARLVDLYGGLVGNWSSYVSPDQLHPNLDGYHAMARIWFDNFLNLQLSTGKAVSGQEGADAAKAILHGSASANGQISGLGFEYGLDEFMGSSVTATPDSGDGSTPIIVTAEIGGLQFESLYYYRLFATFNGQTYHGDMKSFITPKKVMALPGIQLLLLGQADDPVAGE